MERNYKLERFLECLPVTYEIEDDWYVIEVDQHAYKIPYIGHPVRLLFIGTGDVIVDIRTLGPTEGLVFYNKGTAYIPADIKMDEKAKLIFGLETKRKDIKHETN